METKPVLWYIDSNYRRKAVSETANKNKIRPLVSDYRMNLIQVRSSESLHFSNPDVDTVFDVSRSIYARNYAKIRDVYKDRELPTDIGLVIGAITESQQLINHALATEQKGGRINMCTEIQTFGFHYTYKLLFYPNFFSKILNLYESKPIKGLDFLFCSCTC